MRLPVWPEEPGGTVITSARKHQQRTNAGPSSKGPRHACPARVSRFVVESENHELHTSSGTYVKDRTREYR